jgi:hypothetical protein
MTIRLRWCPIEGADVKLYKIHRSILGFRTPTEAPFGLVNGDELKLRINNNTLQTITFDADYEIDDLVSFLNNELEGARAYKDVNSNHLFVRSSIRDENGFIEVFGGSAVTKLGLTTRRIETKSESELIDTVDCDIMEYCDLNGVIQDYYALSVVDNLDNESKKTQFLQAVSYAGDICVIEGFICDLQGARRCDVEVTARIVNPPENKKQGGYILQDEISTITGEDGRFSLPLLQGSSVLFEINRARISDPVIVPSQSFVLFDELNINGDYKMIDLLAGSTGF